MSEFQIKFPGKQVNVIFEDGIINSNWSFLDSDKRYLVITDTNLTKIYGKLLKVIPNLITIISIKPGEPAKSFTVYEKIIHTLQEVNFRKNDVMIAFGGGVICDLTGFIASTYQQGISYIQIPTSLVAQTSSSVGGKCGINYHYKNALGTIYQPEKVIIDIHLLKTLPKDELNYGIVEMIRYGFVKDDSIIDDLQKFNLPFKKDLLISLIERCLKGKIALMQKDKGNDENHLLLLFGSFYGQIIEVNSKYKIPYGKAVAFGMYYELAGSPYQEALLELLKKYHLESNIEKYTITFNDYINYHKKTFTDKIVMVDIKKIGLGKLIEKGIE